MTEPPEKSWHEVASRYNELPLWSAPFGQLILDQVPMLRGQKILDVGAGTGFLSIELAQRCGPETAVLAVDPRADALAVLSGRAHELGLSNITVSATDAARLTLPANSLDVIVSNLGINNFDNRAEVLLECWRVLRPAGRMLISTNLIGTMSEFYDIFTNVLSYSALDSAPLHSHIAGRASIASVRADLEAAGFIDIDDTQASFRMRFADGTALLNHSFIRLGFRPAWEAAVPEEERTAMLHTLEIALNELSASAGDLALSIPMACFSASKPARGAQPS